MLLFLVFLIQRVNLWKNIVYICPSTWNRAPVYVRNILNYNVFKFSLKIFYCTSDIKLWCSHFCYEGNCTLLASWPFTFFSLSFSKMWLKIYSLQRAHFLMPFISWKICWFKRHRLDIWIELIMFLLYKLNFRFYYFLFWLDRFVFFLRVFFEGSYLLVLCILIVSWLLYYNHQKSSWWMLCSCSSMMSDDK